MAEGQEAPVRAAAQQSWQQSCGRTKAKMRNLRPETQAGASCRVPKSIFSSATSLMHRTQGNCKLKSDAAGKAHGSILDFFIPKPHRDDDGRGPPPAGGSFSGAGGGGGGITA